VAWAWWRGRTRSDTRGLQAAILCLATPLALPMVYLYDLVLAVPAAAWLWADLQQRGAHPGERALLISTVAALLTVKAVAMTFGVQLGPLLLALLLGLALRRHHAALATALSVPSQPAIH